MSSEQQASAEPLPGTAVCPPNLLWVLVRKDETLKLHSSEDYSDVFPLDCGGCKLYYQHCMFSKKERKSDNPGRPIFMCRWCSTEREIIQADQFEIHMHIHCNKRGKKRCGRSCTMEPPMPPKPVIKSETRLEDVAPKPEVEFVVKKKMTQKERKAAAAAEKAALGF